MDRSGSLVVAFLLFVLCLSAVLLFSPFGETAAFSQPPVYNEVPLPEAADTLAISYRDAPIVSTPTFTVMLPLVMADYRDRLACSPGSPFSIEIAAIHQVVPDASLDASQLALAEAEWLERIEEGFPTLVEALAETGACWTRVELKWAQIQPDPPPAPYRFSYFDEKLQLLAESGVQIIALVHGVPQWASEELAGPIYPDRIDEFAQFLTDLVGRYKQPPYNIHHWELFNEPDQTERPGWPGGYGFYGDQYADMLALAYPAIKAADSSATVLMGGIAYDWFEEYEGGGPFNRYFPDDVMAAGGGYFLDATNFHQFPDFWAEWERWNTGPPPTCGIVDDGLGNPYEARGIDVTAKTTHFRNRLRVCFGVDKPIWITEMGEHGFAADLDSLGQQARYILQGYARALAVGVENITWFALVSPPYDSQQQGLLYEDDWSPKPAFYTYQTLTDELTGYQYSHTLDVPKVEGYVFRNSSGHEKVVAWSWGQALDSGSLIFTPASKLRVVDREGQVTFVQDGGLGDADQMSGSVTIHLPAVPVPPDPPRHTRYTAEPLIISK